jgi:transposase-like protein
MPRKTNCCAARQRQVATARQRPTIVEDVPATDDLSGFACPNEDCGDFNRFAAGNLQVCERMGKDRRIRRLYCTSCGQRFSERQGSLLAHSKLPEETVVRVVKCLGYGCSIAATADICEVDPRTVELLLSKAGQRAEDFHRLQLERLPEPPAAVELDELHAPLASPKKGIPQAMPALPANRENDAAKRGFTWHCWPRRGL